MVIDIQEMNIEYPEETKARFIEIFKKEAVHQELTMGEVSMLFFWKQHQTEPRFDFVKDYLNSVKVEEKKEKTKANKKPRRRKFKGEKKDV